jgi:hypothetical protein
MKTGTILDLDMASLGRLLQGSLRWWLDELSGMVPRGWQRAERPMAGLVVDVDAYGGMTSAGAEISEQPDAQRPATILLPAASVLIRDVDLPNLRLPDLRKLVALDLDRLMPFAADSAYADIAFAGPDSGAANTGKIAARIAGVSKIALREYYQSAVGYGLAPRAIGLANADGDGVEFDFLPALVADGTAAARNGANRWWMLVALLFTANAGFMVWKDVNQVAQIQGYVDAQKPLVAASRKLSVRLTNEDKLRGELIAARQTDNPLTALAMVTRTMPQGAWVQRYSWTGDALQISGYKQDKVDILGAFRKTGAFSSVRASASDVAAATADSGQPFEITADWKAK